MFLYECFYESCWSLITRGVNLPLINLSDGSSYSLRSILSADMIFHARLFDYPSYLKKILKNLKT